MLTLKIITAAMTFAMPAAMPEKQEPETVRARITYYHDKVNTASGVYPQRGVTVAAHPDLEFGATIEIPGLKDRIGDGMFKVQDRGPAVTARKASRGKTPVIDVYVNSYAEIDRKANSLPMYMDILIHD